MTLASVRRRRAALWFLVALAVTIVLVFPIYWMFMTAVSPTENILSRNPSLIPIRFDGEVFALVARDPRTTAWFANSVYVTAASTIVATIVATLAGYALSRFRVRGSQSVIFTMFLGRLLPGTLIALPFFVMFRLIGLIGTLPAVIISNVSVIVPFATLMMRSYFDGVPRELDEAARVDGCSRFAAMWRILIPVSTTGIAATAIFAATASWTDLLFARTLLFDANRWTIPVAIASMVGDVEIDWNRLMAAGTISVLPVLVLYWFAQKYLVEGMTAGAIKG